MRKIHQTALLIFIEVFPVLVIGVKTAKTVQLQVRRGDNIVLNCTCFREINGEWNGPNISSLSNDFKEGDIMPYATGLKLNPILKRSNIHVVGDYDTNTCSLVISDFSVMNGGTYKCQYIKNNTTNTHVFKVQMICQPMFVFGDDKTHYGQYGKEINITFNIFSSSEIRVTIIKTNRIHTFEALVEPYNSTCKGYLEFHGVNITIVCTRFSFSFGTDDLKNYTVEVCNKHGCINRVVGIVSETVTENEHDCNMLSLWISVLAIMTALIIGFRICVSLKNKMKGREKQATNISDSELRSDTRGESVENRLYQSADNLEATAVRNQSPNRYDVDVLSTVSTRSIVLTRNQEETTEQGFSDARLSQIGNPTLNYTQVVFEAAGSSTVTQIRAFVHGAEDRTLYSEIDLLYRASESDDDDFMYVDGIEQFTLRDNKHAT